MFWSVIESYMIWDLAYVTVINFLWISTCTVELQ